jgi:ABC-type dipeptide/oligopeptide/nickel transport system permease subunit
MSSESAGVASFIIFVQWEKCWEMTRSLIRAKKQNKYVEFMGVI